MCSASVARSRGVCTKTKVRGLLRSRRCRILRGRGRRRFGRRGLRARLRDCRRAFLYRLGGAFLYNIDRRSLIEWIFDPLLSVVGRV